LPRSYCVYMCVLYRVAHSPGADKPPGAGTFDRLAERRYGPWQAGHCSVQRCGIRG
jgi:hypothetical protein